jgi:hypothetical protein
VASEEQLRLVTEATLVPKARREHMMRIMFETFRAQAMCVENLAALSCDAWGRTAGISELVGRHQRAHQRRSH